ncbi:MAG: rod-binding protein [Pseudomonadota bacterium]
MPDLIVDVMAAADPASQRVAVTKLERLSSAADANFAATIDGKMEAGRLDTADMSAPGSGTLPVRMPDDSGHATLVREVKTDRSVYRKFEAFVLQTFVESMLPHDASVVFGKGTAGTIWRSMLAEQIGNEMAKGNGVGIANQLAKARHSDDTAAAKG